MTAKIKPIALILFMLPLSILAQQGDQIFNTSFLHEVRINFPINDYRDSLRYYYEEYSQFSGSDIPYLQATIEIDDTLLDSVGIRYKGKSSYYYVNEKKPIKIDFNEFVSGQEYDGLKKINLHNAIGDPGMMRDLLCYDMMRAAGVAAPRISFCHVFFNDEYAGVYKIVEQVDKTFLKNNFANGNGNLYKNQRWSNLDWWGADPTIYQDTFELKTNVEEGDWSNFIHFLDVLNNTSDEDFPQAIQEVFNVDQYLHVLAVDIMTNNWDSYISNRRNWYLYHEPESGKFQWIPWDYNLALGGRLTTSGNPYPPFDDNCLIQTTFSAVTDGLNVEFAEFSEPAASSWFWDFGDGASSSEQHPTHTFTEQQKVNVCLTSRRDNNGTTCEQTRCKVVDLSFDPSDCNSVQNGTSPYPGTDPLFQLVIAEDDHCCSGDWDVFCEIAYQELSNNPPAQEISSGIDYGTDFPLLLDNPEKILIDRLLNVPEYKDRYLDICCVIRGSIFSEEKLFPKIDFYADLLRDPVFFDPYYNYATDYFAYDVGNGTGGGSEAKIPALKYFFNQRFPQIDTDLSQAQQDCSTTTSPIAWKEVVINEFMAANTAAGGIPDPEGEYNDWIELYNNTNAPIDLSGFYLSDNATTPKQWPFPRNTIIPANGYLIVWADKDPGGIGLHANFKLSKSGEEILLSHEDETWIDYVSFAEQSDDIASARIPNGTGPFLFQAPTFNRDNSTVGSKDLINTQAVNIYPNPASSELFVELKDQTSSQKGQLQITNNLGAIIYTQTLPAGNQWHIDLKNEALPSGMYFLKIEFSHQLILQKLLIES